MTRRSRLHLYVIVWLPIALACAIVPAFPTARPVDTATAISPSQAIRVPTERPVRPQASPSIASPTVQPPALTPTLGDEDRLRAVSNDSASITVSIPETWTDVRSLPWTNDKNEVVGDILIASPDADRFLQWETDGISIWASRKLGIGYIELLDSEWEKLETLDPSPVAKYWDFADSHHRGKSFRLFLCGGPQGCLLDVFALVPNGDGRAYVAKVLLYDDLPYRPNALDDRIMEFEVNPARLP